MIRRAKLVELISAALILLWVYTAVSKLSDYPEFKQQLSRQAISPGAAAALAPLLPIAELLLAALLVFRRTRQLGLRWSAGLMVVFTTYVGLVVFGYFPKHSCACGGVLKGFGWTFHFYFNLGWLALAVTGFILSFKGAEGGEHDT